MLRDLILDSKQGFEKGYNVSSQRIKLARTNEYDFQKIRNWVEKEKELNFKGKEKKFKLIGSGFSLMGSLIGYYSTFCFLGLQLYSFDKEVEFIRDLID